MTPCSEAAAHAGESLSGTAVAGKRHWVALELRGSWRPKAIIDNTLPTPVQAWMRALMGRGDTRPVLIKQRGKRQGTTVFYADAATDRVHRFDLAGPEEVVSLPWTELMAGTTDLGRTGERPLLVCTHSTRDHCCGLHGPAVVRALQAQAPDRVWQCSHLGGHRFAATLVALPAGVHYGRIRASEAADLLEALDRGEVHDLSKLRGRVTLPAPAQAAEGFIRDKLDLRRLDAVQVPSWTEVEDGATVQLEADGQRFTVQVQRVAGPAETPSSCGADPTPIKGWVCEELPGA